MSSSRSFRRVFSEIAFAPTNTSPVSEASRRGAALQPAAEMRRRMSETALPVSTATDHQTDADVVVLELVPLAGQVDAILLPDEVVLQEVADLERLLTGP